MQVMGVIDVMESEVVYIVNTEYSTYVLCFTYAASIGVSALIIMVLFAVYNGIFIYCVVCCL